MPGGGDLRMSDSFSVPVALLNAIGFAPDKFQNSLKFARTTGKSCAGEPQADALGILWRLLGILAFKKIFPALQSMTRRGRLSVPVIGVAKAGSNLDQFRERAEGQAVSKPHGGRDPHRVR